jgi:uncharacterized protein (TIGR00369 family)
MMTTIPEGFRRVELAPNPFLEHVGPLYARFANGEFVLGFRVEQDHCNPAGTCHGGMMSTLADMLLILGANAQADLRRYLTTVSLNTDFVGPAPLGAWLEGRMQVVRVTRSLVFAQGTMTCGGEAVMRTSGILKPVGDSTPALGADRYAT